jgi:hypothetical protein
MDPEPRRPRGFGGRTQWDPASPQQGIHVRAIRRLGGFGSDRRDDPVVPAGQQAEHGDPVGGQVDRRLVGWLVAGPWVSGCLMSTPT